MKTMRFSFLLAILIVSAWSSVPAKADDVHIAVATNFRTTLTKLAGVFEAQTGHKAIISSGATGALHAQILNGAPYDVFLAADMERPGDLASRGLGIDESLRVYAHGRLVLWADGEIEDVRARLGTPQPGDHIAIANPAIAPYGRAARQAMNAMGLEGHWAERTVMGQNVGQAFAFVQTGNAVMAFVAHAQILEHVDSHETSFSENAIAVPGEFYEPLMQGALLLKRSASNPAANSFYQFLYTDKAQNIIANSGYSPAEPGARAGNGAKGGQ